MRASTGLQVAVFYCGSFKGILANQGGIEAILKAMVDYPESESVQACCCEALHATRDIKWICAQGGIEASVKAMDNHPPSVMVAEKGGGVLQSIWEVAERKRFVWGNTLPESTAWVRAGAGRVMKRAVAVLPL